ncbi:MAG TPA: 3-phosphoglycerate dehydrogenase [Clostridia bacterium]|nr:3-phosphoglycerate dehydrogenase [Clostridia bacterium]
MKDILTLSEISPLAAENLGNSYAVVNKAENPEGILVRAFEMKDYNLAKSVKIIARAGAGVNNIPLDRYASEGVIVCNTPGANSNGVKELTILALLLCGRDVFNGMQWTQGLTDGETTVEQQVEKGKKNFVGTEIMGKTLGLIGFGEIGRKVAESAHCLGMDIIFVDPFYTAQVPDWAKQVQTNEEVFAVADIITLHVPLLDATRGFINDKTISLMKDGACLVNIARGELVDNDAMLKNLDSGKIKRYVTDFPFSKLVGHKKVVTIPHLGASTFESEDNCAVMAARQIKSLLEKGDIINSVNYPNISFVNTGKIAVILFKASSKESIESFVGKQKTNKYEIKVKKEFGAAKIDFVDNIPVKELENISGVIKVLTI